MRYLKLAELYESLSQTTKRLEKTEILSKFLKELSESDKEVLYLLLRDIPTPGDLYEPIFASSSLSSCASSIVTLSSLSVS